jgi:hypothetical protein
LVGVEALAGGEGLFLVHPPIGDTGTPVGTENPSAVRQKIQVIANGNGRDFQQIAQLGNRCRFLGEQDVYDLLLTWVNHHWGCPRGSSDTCGMTKGMSSSVKGYLSLSGLLYKGFIQLSIPYF